MEDKISEKIVDQLFSNGLFNPNINREYLVFIENFVAAYLRENENKMDKVLQKMIQNYDTKTNDTKRP